MDVELQELVTRSEEVQKRICELHLAADILQEFAAGRAPAPAGPGSSIRRLRPSPPGRPDSALRRACRIALLEVTEAINEHEIYLRIVRRGSFSFPRPAFALTAIAREMNHMAADGEACCLKTGGESRWQRALILPAPLGLRP